MQAFANQVNVKPLPGFPVIQTQPANHHVRAFVIQFAISRRNGMFPSESGSTKSSEDRIIRRLAVLDELYVRQLQKNPFVQTNAEPLEQFVRPLVEAMREKAYFGGLPNTLPLPLDNARYQQCFQCFHCKNQITFEGTRLPPKL